MCRSLSSPTPDEWSKPVSKTFVSEKCSRPWKVFKIVAIRITNIMFLDIVHRPVFSKNTFLFISQNTTFRRLDFVSVFRSNLLSRAQSIELVPNSGDTCRRRQNPISETLCFEKISRTLFLDTDRTMDNVQNHNICTNVASAQTYTSYLTILTLTHYRIYT
jgi:hypothetical protein